MTEPKTKNSVRKVALSQQAVDMLVREHEQHPDNPILFPSPRTGGYWSPDAVSRINRKLLVKAGIEEHVRFHDLRHTFATMALSSGVDVKTLSSMLGHFSAGFTLDTYTHITNDMQRGAAEDRRFHGNGPGQAGTGTARPAGGEPVQGDPVRKGRINETTLKGLFSSLGRRPLDTILNIKNWKQGGGGVREFCAKFSFQKTLFCFGAFLVYQKRLGL